MHSADDVNKSADAPVRRHRELPRSPAPPMTSCELAQRLAQLPVFAEVEASTLTPNSCCSRCHDPCSRRPAQGRRGSVRDTSTQTTPVQGPAAVKGRAVAHSPKGTAAAPETTRSSDTHGDRELECCAEGAGPREHTPQALHGRGLHAYTPQGPLHGRSLHAYTP